MPSPGIANPDADLKPIDRRTRAIPLAPQRKCDATDASIGGLKGKRPLAGCPYCRIPGQYEFDPCSARTSSSRWSTAQRKPVVGVSLSRTRIVSPGAASMVVPRSRASTTFVMDDLDS
jgi:hypothetical protein